MVTTSRRKTGSGAVEPKITELQLHRAVSDLLDWVLMEPVVWTTFPAGWGKLGPATAGQLYAAGLKRGFPDIFIWGMRAIGDKPLRIDKYIDPVCIGIELKTGKNTLTPEQKDVHERLREVGVDVYVCRSVNDVIMTLADAGIPYRKNNITIPKGKTDVEIRSNPVFGSGVPGDG